VKIVNFTKSTVVGSDFKLASSLQDKLLGLLSKDNSRCLLFKTRFGIHTFFLKEPIDIIVLDRSFKVVKVSTSVAPNRLFFWNPLNQFVLELPQKNINLSQTEVGDILKIQL